VVTRSDLLHITRKELAARVGCTVQQLSKWMKAIEPPETMRSVNRDALADGLKVEKAVLFERWKSVSPQEAPYFEHPGNGGLTWGRWIIARARHLGFKSQQALAQAVGCSEEHVSRWHAMRSPPTHMRRGYDDALARALQIDRRTLFDSWSSVPPKEARTVLAAPDQSVPWNASHPINDKTINEIVSLMQRMRKEDLDDVLGVAAAIAWGQEEWLPHILKRRSERISEQKHATGAVTKSPSS